VVPPRGGPHPRARQRRPPDSLHLSRTLADRGIFKGSFSPEVTAIIDAALQLITVDDPDTPAEQRRAEALAMICQYVLDHHDKPRTRRNRPHVAVIMREGPDGNPVGETLQGVPVSRGRLQQWLCDGLVGRVMTAGSHILWPPATVKTTVNTLIPTPHPNEPDTAIERRVRETTKQHETAPDENRLAPAHTRALSSGQPSSSSSSSTERA
jgi:hypothetical protein